MPFFVSKFPYPLNYVPPISSIRQPNVLQKTDMLLISRETEAILPEYKNKLFAVHGYL